MKKIVTVVGARPQFIKAAAVSRVLRANGSLEEVLVHTGQHYDDGMSDIFFRELDIPRPSYSLGIGSGSHGDQTGRMLAALENMLLKERPDWVLIYGDTNSTLAGALAAVKLHIPIAHVEAGLRSFNRRMPEEINRVVSDHVSDLLFAPTDVAVKNLHDEGLDPIRIRNVGDVMYDAALFYGAKARTGSDILRRLGLATGDYVLATIHRAENTDSPERLGSILNGLIAVSKSTTVVLPLHPRTRKSIGPELEERLSNANVLVLDPVGYLDMVMLEGNARVIATDSGGVQKEAYFYKIPCITLREETEWTELVEMGWNKLVPPTDPIVIEKAILQATAGKIESKNPYGDGNSAELIVNTLIG